MGNIAYPSLWIMQDLYHQPYQGLKNMGYYCPDIIRVWAEYRLRNRLGFFHRFPDPRKDPKSRSLKGVPIKYPLVARVPN